MYMTLCVCVCTEYVPFHSIPFDQCLHWLEKYHRCKTPFRSIDHFNIKCTLYIEICIKYVLILSYGCIQQHHSLNALWFQLMFSVFFLLFSLLLLYLIRFVFFLSSFSRLFVSCHLLPSHTRWTLSTSSNLRGSAKKYCR